MTCWRGECRKSCYYPDTCTEGALTTEVQRLAGMEATSARVAANALSLTQDVQARLDRVRGLIAAYGEAEGTPSDYEFLVHHIREALDG